MQTTHISLSTNEIHTLYRFQTPIPFIKLGARI